MRAGCIWCADGDDETAARHRDAALAGRNRSAGDPDMDRTARRRPRATELRRRAVACRGTRGAWRRLVQIGAGRLGQQQLRRNGMPGFSAVPGPVVPADGFFERLHVVARSRPDGDGELIAVQALVAIHWAHRAFALLVVVAVGVLVWQLWRSGFTRLPQAIGRFVAIAVAHWLVERGAAMAAAARGTAQRRRCIARRLDHCRFASDIGETAKLACCTGSCMTAHTTTDTRPAAP